MLNKMWNIAYKFTPIGTLLMQFLQSFPHLYMSTVLIKQPVSS